MQAPVLHCFTLAFTSAGIIFHNFLELHSTLSGLFRMIYTFTEMFGSPSTTVLSSFTTTIAFF